MMGFCGVSLSFNNLRDFGQGLFTRVEIGAITLVNFEKLKVTPITDWLL